MLAINVLAELLNMPTRHLRSRPLADVPHRGRSRGRHASRTAPTAVATASQQRAAAMVRNDPTTSAELAATQLERNIEHCLVHIKHQRIGRAASVLERDPPVEPTTSAVQQQLRDCHPPASSALPSLIDAPSVPVPSPDVVKQVLKRCANGSAPGVSGWTGDLLGCLSGDVKCTELLCHLLHVIINGNIPRTFRRRLLASRLIPLPKKSGGVRPIAIPEAIVKCAELTLLTMISKPIISKVFRDSPQFGQLEHGGAETAVHAIQLACSESVGGPECIVISLDVKNAFNSVRRVDVMAALCRQKEFDLLRRYVHFQLNDASPLLAFDRSGARVCQIDSAEGVRQGAPMSGVLFDLTMQPIYRELMSRVRQSIAAAATADSQPTPPPHAQPQTPPPLRPQQSRQQPPAQLSPDLNQVDDPDSKHSRRAVAKRERETPGGPNEATVSVRQQDRPHPVLSPSLAPPNTRSLSGSQRSGSGSGSGSSVVSVGVDVGARGGGGDGGGDNVGGGGDSNVGRNEAAASVRYHDRPHSVLASTSPSSPRSDTHSPPVVQSRVRGVGVGVGDVVASHDAGPIARKQGGGVDVDRVFTSVAVHDDLTLVGDAASAFLGVEQFATMLSEHGLVLSRDKCRVLWPHRTPVPDRIRKLCGEHRVQLAVGTSMELLGSRVGLLSDADATLFVEWVEQSSHRFIQAMRHPHMPLQFALCLLRVSFIPRLHYQLRTLPPSVTRRGAERIDAIVMSTLLQLLEINDNELAPATRRLIALPTRMGGLGIRSQRLVSDAAFYACFAESAHASSRVLDPATCLFDGHIAESALWQEFASLHTKLVAHGVRRVLPTQASTPAAAKTAASATTHESSSSAGAGGNSGADPRNSSSGSGDGVGAGGVGVAMADLWSWISRKQPEHLQRVISGDSLSRDLLVNVARHGTGVGAGDGAGAAAAVGVGVELASAAAAVGIAGADHSLAVRMKSFMSSHACAWLHCVPREAGDGFYMQNDTMRMAIRHHLNLPLAAGLPEICPTCNTVKLREWPSHVLCCRQLSSRATLRHTCIVTALYDLLHALGVTVRMEHVLPKIHSTSSRSGGRDGIADDDDFEHPNDARIDILARDGDATYFIDVSCVHPLAACHRKLDPLDSEKAMEKRAKSKFIRYGEHAAAARAEIIPFVCDAYGRFGEHAHTFVKKVMGRRAAGTGRAKTAGVYYRYALARLSVAVQVGNVRAAESAISKIRAECTVALNEQSGVRHQRSRQLRQTLATTTTATTSAAAATSATTSTALRT